MKHFFIIPNYSKERTYSCACRIRSFLMEHGASCEILQASKEPKRTYLYTDVTQIPSDTECVIVLGGDGTLIQAVHDLGERSIPVIGVNLGHIGYLTEVDEASIYKALERLLKEEYLIEERMMLQGAVIRDGEVIDRNIAVNDIILSRKDILKMVYFSLYVDGQFLSRYAADGLIVSTPTGSTAYSLSAGGPIVMPSSYVFVITPICPHTAANARSIILPRDAVIELEVEGHDDDAKHAGCVNYDAHSAFELYPQDRIRITCADSSMKMIRMNKTSFLETLRKKLNS